MNRIFLLTATERNEPLAVQLQNFTRLHSSIEAFLIGQANTRKLGTNLPFSFILPRFDLCKS